MKIEVKIVNKDSESISVGLDQGVKIKSGTHTYKLTKKQADEVVNTASVLSTLEVQLIQQPTEVDPSTVDGVAKVKAELATSKAELAKALASIIELEKSKADLAAEIKALKAGGDKSVGDTPTVKKTAEKTTSKKTENKE